MQCSKCGDPLSFLSIRVDPACEKMLISNMLYIIIETFHCFKCNCRVMFHDVVKAGETSTVPKVCDVVMKTMSEAEEALRWFGSHNPAVVHFSMDKGEGEETRNEQT